MNFCLHVYCVQCVCLQRSEEDIRSTRTGIIYSCELPCGCWEPNLVLHNSNDCSYPLRHLARSSHTILNMFLLNFFTDNVLPFLTCISCILITIILPLSKAHTSIYHHFLTTSSFHVILFCFLTRFKQGRLCYHEFGAIHWSLLCSIGGYLIEIIVVYSSLRIRQ